MYLYYASLSAIPETKRRPILTYLQHPATKTQLAYEILTEYYDGNTDYFADAMEHAEIVLTEFWVDTHGQR